MMNPRENMLRAIKNDRPEYVPNALEHLIEVKCPTCERPIKAGFDIWGVEWAYDPHAEGGTYVAHGSKIIHNIDNWRAELKIPDLDKDVDWSYITQNWGEFPLDVASIDYENNVVMGLVEMGVFERLYLLFGMEEALMNFITHPEEMAKIAEVIADYKIRVIQRFAKEIKLDMIWYGDDWGTQNNLFMPPETWRQCIKPATKRIYDAIHDLGLIVNQHSCGHIAKIFDDMVDMGADVWNMCQPCNDLGKLKQQLGDRKFCFSGGLDSQFVLNKPGATPDDVRAEVRLRMKQLKGTNGGYIAGPSHEVPYAKEMLDAMFDELDKTKFYDYTK